LVRGSPGGSRGSVGFRALHLATLHYLSHAGQRVSLATFDARLHAAAEALGIRLAI